MKALVWMILILCVLVLVLIGNSLRTAQVYRPTPSLTHWQVVDLTHPLRPDIPLWKGDPPIEISPWATYSNNGYFINRLSIGEHSGTHWGSSKTFIEGGTSSDRVPLEHLVLSTALIDIREQAAHNSDYRLSVEDIRHWEAIHGRVPTRALVILFTGWLDHWTNPDRFFNQDSEGIAHFPGFSTEVVEFLVVERQITGLGTDTHGVDPGSDDTYGASQTIYRADGLVLECLAGLHQLPALGATVVIGGLPIQGGAGSPARILALLPPALQT